MADLIIKRFDSKNDSLTADKKSRYLYTMGDIVEVREDGGPYGGQMKLAFWFIQFPGVPKADVEFLMGTAWDAVLAETPVKRRMYNVPKFEQLPPTAKNYFTEIEKETIYRCDVPWSNVVEYITKKAGLEEPIPGPGL